MRWAAVAVLCAACREWPCEGPPAGAFVCQTCSGASDSNTGTIECPLRTINSGIAHARAAGLGEVSIAAGGEYAEDVVVPTGIALRGSSPGVRTTLRNTTPQGLRFAAGARGASVSGLRIIAMGTGISIVDASASLQDFEVVGDGRPAQQIGVNIVATGAARPHVWLGSYKPEVPRSSITGIHASLEAIGLRVQGTSPLVFGLDVSDVSGAGAAIGAVLVDAPGFWWDDGTVTVKSIGLMARGDLGSLELSGLAVSADEGVAFDGCTGQPLLRDSSVTAGALGVRASGGCAATVHRSRVSGAVGVWCEGHSPCTLSENPALGTVRIEDSKATVSRSYIGGSGLKLLRSAARVTNSFVEAPLVALEVTASAAEVNSCTFVSTGAGARLNGPGTMGAFVNNVFVGTPAFVEAGPDADPLALRGNDFFSPDGGALYVDEGITVFDTPSQIDAESRSFDPGFAPAPPVLSLGSLLKAQGPLDAGVPDIDIRGMARHAPPDIGAYELQ